MHTKITIDEAERVAKEYMAAFGYIFVGTEEIKLGTGPAFVLNFLSKEVPAFDRWMATIKNNRGIEAHIKRRLDAQGVATSVSYWVTTDGKVTVTII